MRRSPPASRIRLSLRRAWCLAVVVVATGCFGGPRIARRYDAQCEELGSFGVTARTRRSAVQLMKQKVQQLGGNTLLLGEDALQQLNIHRAQQSIESSKAAAGAAVERGEQLPASDGIIDPVVVGIRTPDGESAFNGAALRCGQRVRDAA
jgi:hypothetical protein